MTARGSGPVPILAIAALAAGGAGGCLVQRLCFSDEECPGGLVCSESGACVRECTTDPDCPDGFVCEGERCVPEQIGPISCPPDMAAVADSFCMDRWEASRPDATPASQGTDGSVPLSRPGVLPWTELHAEEAAAACAAAGKRICEPGEWEFACRGTAGGSYVYGDAYDPVACNGIDTYGAADNHMMPTGSFPSCVDEWGVHDLSGNVYEHVAGGHDWLVRGGSHKSLDSMAELRCDYVPMTWVPCFCSLGFRCCLTPVEETGG